MFRFIKTIFYLSLWLFIHSAYAETADYDEQPSLRQRYRARVEDAKKTEDHNTPEIPLIRVFDRSPAENPEKNNNSIKVDRRGRIIEEPGKNENSDQLQINDSKNEIYEGFLESLIAPPGSELEEIIIKINALDDAQFAEANDRLSPAQFIGLNWLTASLISRTTHLIADRCNDLPSRCLTSSVWEKDNELWAEGLYDHLDQKRIENLQGFKASSGGVFVGYDRNLSEFFPNLRVGAAAGYLHSRLNWLESFGSSWIHHTFLGLYAAYCRNSFNINTSLLGAWQNYRNERTFSILAPGTTARSQYNGASAAFHAGGRYTFFLPQEIELIPFGSMDWIYISQKGFNESNAGSLNLHVQKNGESFLRSEWGIALSRPLCCKWGAFVPKANISWLFLTPISGNRITANLVDSTDSSSVQTTNQWVNQFAAGLELLLWMHNDLSFGGIYKGIFGGAISEQEIRATAIWKF